MESGKKIVEKLKCKVCTEFVDKIRGRKHFSDKWICGADSVRTSNVRDHLHNDQHSHTMSLLKKQRAEASGLGSVSYAPIAKAFTGTEAAAKKWRGLINIHDLDCTINKRARRYATSQHLQKYSNCVCSWLLKC